LVGIDALFLFLTVFQRPSWGVQTAYFTACSSPVFI